MADRQETFHATDHDIYGRALIVQRGGRLSRVRPRRAGPGRAGPRVYTIARTVNGTAAAAAATTRRHESTTEGEPIDGPTGRHQRRRRRVLPPPGGGAGNRGTRCPFVHQDQLIRASMLRRRCRRAP